MSRAQRRIVGNAPTAVDLSLTTTATELHYRRFESNRQQLAPISDIGIVCAACFGGALWFGSIPFVQAA